MSIIQSQQFKLKSRHFHTGITNEDITEYIGGKNSVHSFDNFPGWDLVQEGLPLSELQRVKRELAIKKVIPSHKPTIIGNLTEAKTACVLISFAIKLPSDTIAIATNYDNCQLDLTKAINQYNIYQPQKNTPPIYYVYPLPSKNASYQATPEIMAKDCSIVINPTFFLPPINQSGPNYWSCRLNSLKQFITHYPNPKPHILDNLIHEMRHTKQIYSAVINEHDDNRFQITYINNREIDADLFSRDSFRQFGISKDFSSTNLHTRYTDLGTASITHWHAPAIEAIKNGWDIPDLETTYTAMSLIRRRILKNLSIQHTDISFSKICSNTWGRMTDSLCNTSEQHSAQDWLYKSSRLFTRHPEIAYNKLHKLTRTDAFNTNPLAEHIANSMVKAVDHFCPKMIKGTRVKQASAKACAL